jgi:hypothetical protein
MLTWLMVVLLGILALEGALGGKLSPHDLGPAVSLTTLIVVIGAVGLVVARHQPGNPIGWLLTAEALLTLVTISASSYTTLVYYQGNPGLPLAGPVALVLAGFFPITFIPFPLVVLLFPDGRLPSRRWRWVVGGYLVLSAAAVLSVCAVSVDLIARHHTRVLSDGQLAPISQPAGGTAWLTPLVLVFIASVVLLWLAALIRQIASWRRSSGERRQQLKWLMSGAAVCGAGLAGLATNSALWEVLILGFTALPISIGVGILKYRLYEIDRIISRTLAYAIVTGLLIGVYSGLVLLATRVLTVHTPVAVAAATLAAAALFTPLRRRVQRIVDRRFNRARYDADRTIAAFATRLQDAVDLGTVRDDLAATVQAVLEPAHVSVWVAAPAADTARRLPGGGLAGPVGGDVQPVSAGTAVAVAPRPVAGLVKEHVAAGR